MLIGRFGELEGFYLCCDRWPLHRNVRRNHPKVVTSC